jgi:hypothetical protein
MSGIRPEVEKTVQDLVETLQQHLGSELKSLTLVGSAVTEDFVAGRSDINSVLLVDTIDEQVLSVLAKIGPQMGRKRLRAPLLMTPSYIECSCDVFAVEWLDFQAYHQTLIGVDPFESLTFEKQHVRLQCEKQFKMMQIQLRQGYIRSAERKNEIAALLTGLSKEMLPYLRAMLWLEGAPRSGGFEQTFDAAKERFGVETAAFKAAFAFRYEKLRQTNEEMKYLFAQASEAINKLCCVSDQWGR